jgi:hypothetical protein
MIEHVIAYCDDMMQGDYMPFRHPHCPVSEWASDFHDIPDNGPFIWCADEWLVFTAFWIVERIAGKFS